MCSKMNRLLKLPVIAAVLLTAVSCSVNRRQAEKARELFSHGMEMVELGGGEMAMSDFKKAEPILAEIGDTAGLGEVNYAIAELYQNSVVNQDEAVERYRKALKYFEAAGLVGRVADTHLALARMLLPDSVDAALYHLGIGNDLFPLTLDRSDRLSAYGLYAYAGVIRQDYRSAVSYVSRALSEYGWSAATPSEKDLYNNLFYLASTAYAALGQTDSAALFRDRLVVSNAVDSLNWYLTQAGIAQALGDWKSVHTFETRTRIIADSIEQAGYREQLAAAEMKYDFFRLREELYQRKIHNMTVAMFLLTWLAAAVIVAVIFIILYRNQKSRAMEQAALAGRVRDELIRRQDEVRELQEKMRRTSERQSQEENDLRAITAALRQTATAKKELLAFSEDLLGVTKELADIYYVHEESPEHISRKVKEVLHSKLTQEATFARIGDIVEAAWPDLLPKLYAEYPWLKDEDRRLIALMCCGFSGNAISVILNIPPKSLNVRKSRIARRMGIDTRLSSWLREITENYPENGGKNS